MNIFIYTKKGCPNCVSAKQLLKSKNLSFIEQNMDDTEVRRAFEFAYPNVRGLPQIFIDDQRVGGLAGLQQALKQLALDKKADNARELGLDYEP
jgi:glutaredoxin 3